MRKRVCARRAPRMPRSLPICSPFAPGVASIFGWRADHKSTGGSLRMGSESTRTPLTIGDLEAVANAILAAEFDAERASPEVASSPNHPTARLAV